MPDGLAKHLPSRRTIMLYLVLFTLAFAVRFLTWQNNKVEMAGVQYVLTRIYTADAGALQRGEFGLFLAGLDPPSDATVLLHPPGYPILIAAVDGLVGEQGFRIVQLLLNSLAPLLICLIGRRLFGAAVGTVAGLLTAFAPQFAYHSGLFLPDELAVIPILIAVYFLIRCRDDERLLMALLCGIAIGISCWFRSNALLLPLFFCASLILLVPRRLVVRSAAAILTGFVLVISPITIRNYLVFDAFIPLSLGMGTTFVEGLGDYDATGELGMPSTDEGVTEMDARIAGRPDYIGRLYTPDGIQRDRKRIKAGLSVVAANPLWYASSVIHRGLSTLRLERVPSISPDRDERETTNPVLYWLNVPLKLFQRSFVTAVFLPLFIIGGILLLTEKQSRAKLLILAIVPLYYMTVQALIHTEYRYVLATPHLLMILAAVALVYVFTKIRQTLTG